MSGALLYFYESNSSTPQDTYTDDDLATANANPVVADSAGRFGPIFGGANDYKAILKTSAGVTVFTADPLTAPGTIAAATQSDVDARTSTTKAVTPASIAEGVGLQGSSIVSAAALNIPDVGDYFTVTGTTAITSIEGRTAGRRIVLRFSGALTLTHNATSLILAAGADRTTVAGEIAEFISEGSGNWRELSPVGPRAFPGSTTITSTGGLSLGGGTAVKKLTAAAVSLNFPSIASGAKADLTATVTGAVVGDIALVSFAQATRGSDLFYDAWVSAADTVTVRAFNRTGSAIDASADTFRVVVIGF